MNPTFPERTVTGWRITGPGGVPVIITPSWLVLAVLIVMYFGPQLRLSLPGPQAYLVAFAYAVLLLLSVLVHEAAHALAASAFGYPVERIVVNLFGGHTAYKTCDVSPGRLAIVSAVGPLANGALAAVSFGLLNLAHGQVSWWLLAAAVATNALIGAFNLLPGLPLDGGFVLDALIWKLTGKRHLGLRFAGWAGRVLVALLLVWAIVLPLSSGRTPSFFVIAWAGLIGAVLWSGASSAIDRARTVQALERVLLEPLLHPAICVPGRMPLAEALAHAETGARTVVVLSTNGSPQGVLAPLELDELPAEGRHDLLSAPVSAFCLRQPPGWVLEAGERAWGPARILEAMRSAQTPMVLLRGEHGDSVVLASDLQQAHDLEQSGVQTTRARRG
ncbi:site-2 protease family protein [Gephyromycinifex aptenodytis]|uniref:site-2 protease family protein n=1 Tax=Gephyromycinifex aptenodytis TaxID=2716227 RepID=UPI0014479599|nr:site-2 protease family protein [Gephyromycinifex aptenodytis]